MSPQKSSFRDSVVLRRYDDGIVVNKNTVARESLHGYLRRTEFSTSQPETAVNLGELSQWTRNRYWVDAPHHHFVFSNYSTGAKRKAFCWAAIMQKTGLRRMESDPGVVPIEVATLGKPYIAAYLYAVHEFEIAEIADKLDLSEQSVSQYLTDVGKLRR